MSELSNIEETINNEVEAINNEFSENEFNSEKKAIDLELKKAKIKELQSKVKKLKLKTSSNESNTEGLFGTATEPRKSLNTFLRNQNKLLVSSISIFDRKAALLIRICTATISGLFAFNQYIDTHVVNGFLISTILVIGLLISLILAILSTKPHTSYTKNMLEKQIKPNYPELRNMVFLSPQNSDLIEYEEAMKDVVNSQDLQLGNQIRAYYVLGRNNTLDAILLSLSYNFFLVTFLVAGVIFLISRFALV